MFEPSYIELPSIPSINDYTSASADTPSKHQMHLLFKQSSD